MSVSAIVAAAGEVAYPILVNGYLCFSAAEAASARKFINPAQSATSATASSAYGSAGSSGTESRDVNRPLADGTRGTIINMLV